MYILPMIYIGIPGGALILIWILSLMLPPENMEISRKETVEENFGSSVQGTEEASRSEDDLKNREFYKRIADNKRKNYYMGLLRHPFRTYIRSYYYGLGLGIIFAAIVAIFWLTGGFDALIPHDRMETVFCIMIIMFMTPLAVSFEGRRWYVHNIEAHLPDFLRELSDMEDIGITLHEAIHRISGAKLGVLSSELSVASRDIESGAYVNSAVRSVKVKAVRCPIYEIKILRRILFTLGPPRHTARQVADAPRNRAV